MSLAIFDLDNTLIGGDSDFLWGEFLVEQGLVDGPHYFAENQRYYDDYKRGELDIYAFLAFSLKPLSEHSLERLQDLHRQFMQEKIQPILLPAAALLIDKHRQMGHELLIITATNRFVTGPIAELLGIENLLATEPEMDGKGYTGRVSGTPCYQAGKVIRLQTWLSERQQDLRESWFYSDSHNDIPLLEKVTYPVAVDPDPDLASHAQAKGWQIMTLRR